MDNRLTFYKKTIARWITDRDSSILIVAGGENDRDVFMELGFKNVTISNVDERMKGDEFLPFTWSYQDAENLEYKNDSFDYVIVHAALHHCYSPHRALLSMYRVSKKGAIMIESRDSFVMKVITHLGLTQTYEHAAVFFNDCKYGGVKNSDVPNFIYRWTEREIEKTLNSYAPFKNHCLSYQYGYDMPRSTQRRKKGSYKFYFVRFMKLFYTAFIILFPRQQNLFACLIKKQNLDTGLFKWLKIENKQIVFNKEWAESYYKKSKP